MVWTDDKDIKLLRAVAAEGVFRNNKSGSRERGALWQNVASALVAESLSVTVRSVRDRYNILAKKWRAKIRREEKESGGGDEQLTEVEILVEELVEMETEAEKIAEQKDEAKKAVATEKKKATEMRERALERFGQTRKRHEEAEKDEGKKQPKRRRSGGDALEWLKEKGEMVKQLKEQELQERREERETQKLQHEQFMRQLQATQTTQNDQLKTFQQQMLQQMQQQQQQQQFVILQHQMMAMMNAMSSQFNKDN